MRKNRHAQQEFSTDCGFTPKIDRVESIRRMSYKIQRAIEGKTILWDGVPIRVAYAQGLIPEELFAPAFDLASKRIEAINVAKNRRIR